MNVSDYPTTTITVREQTRDRLRELKNDHGTAYDELINELINKAADSEDSAEDVDPDEYGDGSDRQ